MEGFCLRTGMFNTRQTKYFSNALFLSLHEHSHAQPCNNTLTVHHQYMHTPALTHTHTWTQIHLHNRDA